MLGIWNVNWLNQNSQRAYPLTEDSNLTDTTGAFKLPNDFLLELDLPINAGMDVTAGQFFLLYIGAYATGYSIVVGYQPADASPAIPVATALIASASHVPNNVYSLGGINDFADTVGKVVIGNLDAIAQQPPGLWTFELESSRIEPDCIRPIIQGVASLAITNGDQTSVKLFGDIQLEAGSNCQLVPILVNGQPPTIRVNFVQGEGTIEECVCVGDAAPGEPITSVNGVVPTPSGDFFLLGSECVTLTPLLNGLKIGDTCSKPCCGCAELEKIVQDLERLHSQSATVAAFVQQLQNSVDVMALTVLGSRLNDQGCAI